MTAEAMKNTVEATEEQEAPVRCSCVAATLFCFSLGIHAVALFARPF